MTAAGICRARQDALLMWQVRERHGFPCPSGDVANLFSADPERWLTVLLRIVYAEVEQEAIRSSAGATGLPRVITVVAGPVAFGIGETAAAAAVEWVAEGYLSLPPRFRGTFLVVSDGAHDCSVWLEGAFDAPGALPGEEPSRRAADRISSRLLQHMRTGLSEQLASTDHAP